jgi:hypothetical protein
MAAAAAAMVFDAQGAQAIGFKKVKLWYACTPVAMGRLLYHKQGLQQDECYTRFMEWKCRT